MMNLVDSMVAEGVQPDTTTWSILLEAAHILQRSDLLAAVSGSLCSRLARLLEGQRCLADNSTVLLEAAHVLEPACSIA